MVKKLMPFLSKYTLFAILCPLTVIIEVILEIRIPFLMAKIVDVGIPSKDIAYVLKIGGLMVLMAFVALIFGALSSKFAAQASMGFGSEIRKALFDKVQKFSFANLDKFSTASLVTRLTTDVNNTQNSFMMIIRILVRAPVMMVGASIMALSINRTLVSVFFVAIPFLAVVLMIVGAIAFPRFKNMLRKYDNINSTVQENLIAIRTVKAFVRSKYEKLKFKKANDDLTAASIGAEKVLICTMPLMQLTIYGCIIAILWFGGNMVIAGQLLTGQLISFINYVTQILISLMMISFVFVSMVLSHASVSRIVQVLDEPADLTDDNAREDAKVVDGSVVFENVSFKYSPEAKSNTLENISFSINSGEAVGIVGGTGSAKTTLVQLIPRLYDATEGRVLVDGRDVRKYKMKELRDAVAMVLQKNTLFSGTIKDNLKWGNQNATDEEIVEACKIAQAHNFIMGFPNGYDTVLGQGGVNLSGGQKQRLCIARALLKKPKILILDDSTSAVDTATELKIRNALKEYGSGITVIIIAQRISSVSDADKIIVLDDGKINGIGTHEELLATNQIYKDTYNSQLKGVTA